MEIPIKLPPLAAADMIVSIELLEMNLHAMKLLLSDGGTQRDALQLVAALVSTAAGQLPLNVLALTEAPPAKSPPPRLRLVGGGDGTDAA